MVKILPSLRSINRESPEVALWNKTMTNGMPLGAILGQKHFYMPAIQKPPFRHDHKRWWSFLSNPQTTTTSDKPLHMSDKQQVRGGEWQSDRQSSDQQSFCSTLYLNDRGEEYWIIRDPIVTIIFPGQTLSIKRKQSLKVILFEHNNFPPCNMSVSFKTEMDCPGVAKP